VYPLDSNALKSALATNAYDSDIDEWAALNDALSKIGADAQLGHSYFFDHHNAVTRTGQEEVNVWRDQLLPQLAEILVSFNACNDIDSICDTGQEFGGYTLNLIGKGIDAYPIVVKRLVIE
jgi:hypothetical protein